jgi:hypothetical protein
MELMTSRAFGRLVGVLSLSVVAALALTPVVLAGRPAPPRAPISFAGYSWAVKSSAGKVGPGPNYFSSSPSNVWVDSAGLHMKITRSGGRWYSAEVILQRNLGYGTYRWTLGSSVGSLDRNVVLGLFTWDDANTDNHRELDVEVAKWGNASDPTNAQYVVQPYDAAGHLVRWTQPTTAPTSQAFTWTPSSVAFETKAGASTIQSWTFTGSGVPRPGGENARINLWLYQGRAPANGQPVEVVISNFEFIPAP